MGHGGLQCSCDVPDRELQYRERYRSSKHLYGIDRSFSRFRWHLRRVSDRRHDNDRAYTLILGAHELLQYCDRQPVSEAAKNDRRLIRRSDDSQSTDFRTRRDAIRPWENRDTKALQPPIVGSRESRVRILERKAIPGLVKCGEWDWTRICW